MPRGRGVGRVRGAEGEEGADEGRQETNQTMMQFVHREKIE